MTNQTKTRLCQFVTGFAIITAFLCWLFSATVLACDEPPEMNYMEIMLQAVVDNNPDMGHWAEGMRAEKIADCDLGYTLVSWDDLNELARIVWQEAGSDGINQQWRIDVATVVMNRVYSPEFPNTVYDVVHQSGQYSGASRLWSATPTRECAEAALMALEGLGDLPRTVVFQANFVQGGGVYRSYYLSPYGTTYFCTTSNPSLY